VFHRVLPSRVDAPATLTIDEAAFLPPRVQARELGREPVERRCYVEYVAASDRDKHALGLELERGRCRVLPTPKRGGEGGGRRGADEPGQGQGRAGRGQQEHAPGVLLLAAHGQEGVPLDRDAGGV